MFRAFEFLPHFLASSDASVSIPSTDFAADHAFSLQIASDLHIEFLNALDNGKELEKNVVHHTTGAKYLALLGDIGVVCAVGEEGKPTGMQQYRAFLRAQAKHYEKVIVITGNHEYYNSSVEDVDRRIEEMCAEMPDKLVFLNSQHPSVELCGGKVRVIGCTLWSEVPEDPRTRLEVAMSLNDYRRITVAAKPAKEKLLTPADTTAFHRKDLAAIEKEIAEAKRLGQAAIVLTHHSPIRDFGCSSSEHWRSETRSAFATHLRDLFGNQLIAWCYGHTHWPHDMIIDGTRIIANQGGYLRGASFDSIGYNPRYTLSFDTTPESSVSSASPKLKEKEKEAEESSSLSSE